MTLSDYTKMKNEIVDVIISSVRHTALLNSLKELFIENINSPRRYESIATIRQLLHVLEVRDCLSEDNIVPLKQIALKLPDNTDLMRRIAHYEATHVPKEHVNHYGTEQVQHSNIQECGTNRLPPYSNMSLTKQQRIVAKVINEIGTDWRDLARFLTLCEGDIADIEENTKTMQRKASKVMEIYLTQIADPDRWFLKLCVALEKSRRKDLSKSLNKIVMMNI